MISFFDQFYFLLSSNFYLLCNLGIVLVFSLFLILIINYKSKLLLSPFSIIIRAVWNQFNSETSTLIGKSFNTYGYFCFIISIFTSVLSLNILGLFPYIFSPTVHIAITIGFSFTIILGSTLYALTNFKDEFLSIFTPYGAPIALAPFLVLIEIVSYLAKIISLGVRLAANITAGHLLLAVISSFGFKMIAQSCLLILFGSFFPSLILIFVILLEIAVAFIQAYVFCLLTTIYISEGYHLH